MSLELCQKALDDHGHHVRASEGCHVAKHVRRIQPLLANVQLQQLDQAQGDAFHDLAGQFIFQENPAVTFESTFAHLVATGFQIQGELDIRAEQVGFDRRGIGPALKLLAEDQAGHGIELFGRPTYPGVEMLADLFGRHQLQHGGTKNSLPAIVKTLPSHRGNDAIENVKQASLSRINSMAHVILNSMPS